MICAIERGMEAPSPSAIMAPRGRDRVNSELRERLAGTRSRQHGRNKLVSAAKANDPNQGPAVDDLPPPQQRRWRAGAYALVRPGGARATKMP